MRLVVFAVLTALLETSQPGAAWPLDPKASGPDVTSVKFEKTKASVTQYPVYGPLTLPPATLIDIRKQTASGIPLGDEFADDSPDAIPAPRNRTSTRPAPRIVDIASTLNTVNTTLPKLVGTFDVSAAEPLAGPDLQIAASHSHLVVIAYSNITFWTKEGKLLSQTGAIQFFGSVLDHITKTAKDPATKKPPLQHPMDQCYDTRLLFDPYRNRFWITTLSRNLYGGAESWKFAATITAVSKTENPQDGWYAYWWEPAADMESIGISQKLFVTGHSANGAFPGAEVIQADALANALSSQPKMQVIKNLTNPDGTPATRFMQSAQQVGPSPAAAHFLVTNYPTPDQMGNSLLVWVIEPGDPLKVWRAAVPVGATHGKKDVEQRSHPDIPHPQRIRILDPRPQQAVVRNGKLYTVWHDSDAGLTRAKFRLVRVDVSHFSSDVPIGDGSAMIDRTIGDSSSDYFSPMVAVNTDDAMVLSYQRSGQALFPEARYSVYFGGDADLPTFLLHQGEYPIGRDESVAGNGGFIKMDFIGSAIDPADDRTVWMINAYAVQKTKGEGGYRILVNRVPVFKP